VERELVLRLASLLWRLRRATTIETGLFEIQADHLHEFRRSHQVRPASQEILYATFSRTDSVSVDHHTASYDVMETTEAIGGPGLAPVESAVTPAAELTRCFLRLANLPNYALDRLSRYEATLRRQLAQVIFSLDALDRRKPQERRRQVVISDHQE
jgi:hypothetical protein